MPVRLQPPNPVDIFPVPGIQIGIAQAGVKRADKDDLTIFLLDSGTHVGGVFTKNRCTKKARLRERRKKD